MSHPNWECDVTCDCETCGNRSKNRMTDQEHCGCICKYLGCKCCDWSVQT